MEPVSLAVVGVGRMGRVHLDALAAVPEVEISAVVDVRPDLARTAAAASAAVVYPTVHALLDADVDAWLVATPTPTHPELVELAIDNGVHVLCEKPLALELEDHDRIGAAAVRAGLVLQVGFWRRFSPPWVEAKALVDAGAIGEPLMLRLAQWDASAPPAEFCDPSVSGGLAIDCGVHEYDLIEWLTGRRIERVAARNLPVVDAGVAAVGDVDNLVALLDISGGATATIDLSRNSRYGDDVRTEILGSEGALFIDFLPTASARIGDADGLDVVRGSEVEDGTLAGVSAQATAFAAAIRGAAGEIPGAAESRRAVEVGRAVQAAAQQGAPQQL